MAKDPEGSPEFTSVRRFPRSSEVLSQSLSFSEGLGGVCNLRVSQVSSSSPKFSEVLQGSSKFSGVVLGFCKIFDVSSRFSMVRRGPQRFAKVC